jgi:hypothetical protein
MQRCNFCDSLSVSWLYPAHDFVMEQLGYKSEGAWLACDACHLLIDAGDTDGLLMRSVKIFVATHPKELTPPEIYENVVRAIIRAGHKRFWESRIEAGRAYA